MYLKLNVKQVHANSCPQTFGPEVTKFFSTCTTQGLWAKAMMSLSSQKKAESERLIISNLLNNFIAYTFWDALCLTYIHKHTHSV